MSHKAKICANCGFENNPDEVLCQKCSLMLPITVSEVEDIKPEPTQALPSEKTSTSTPTPKAPVANSKLHKCKDCGNLISRNAKTCPHCGRPQGSVFKTMGNIIRGIAILIVLVIGWAIYSTVSLYTSAPDSTNRLSATTPSDPKINYAGEGHWQYSSNQDAISGKSTWVAVKSSSNLQQLDFPYNGGTYGQLIVRDHPRLGKDVIFSTSNGQLLCDISDGCLVTVRFDDQPARRIQSYEPSDHDPTTLFLNDYGTIVRELRTAKKMIVEVEMYQAGLRQFTFNVEGFHTSTQ